MKDYYKILEIAHDAGQEEIRDRYRGGHAEFSPVQLQIPYWDQWHVVVSRGELPGAVHASLRLVRFR